MSDIQSLCENLNNREILLLNDLQQYPIRVNEGLWLLSEPPKNLLDNVTNNVTTKIFKGLRGEGTNKIPVTTENIVYK